MSLLIQTTTHEPQRDMCIPQPCTIKGLVPALYRANRATPQQQSHNKRWEQFSEPCWDLLWKARRQVHPSSKAY